MFAIIDWYSRYVIEWELSNLLDTEFCIEIEKKEVSANKHLRSLIPTKEFSLRAANSGRLEKRGIRISMDGKGRALDNVFIERLWRSVKYEEIYPKGYESMKEVRMGLKKYFEFYNNKRPHQGLDYRTPAEDTLVSKRKTGGLCPSNPIKGCLPFENPRALYWGSEVKLDQQRILV